MERGRKTRKDFLGSPRSSAVLTRRAAPCGRMTDRETHLRTLRNARRNRYRFRKRHKQVVIDVEVDAKMLARLVLIDNLKEEDARDRGKVALAIIKTIREAARK